MTTYTNPVWGFDFPDPHVLAHRGKFYAYATETGKYGSGFQVLESRDLVHWTHKGLALTPTWSKIHLWAPEVIEHKGVFHMTYSALNTLTNKHDIAIATSRSPIGPFTHRGILVHGDNNRVGVIDTTVIFEGRTPYLIYSEEEPRSIVMRRLSGDLMRVEGPRIELLRPTFGWERGIVEAPTLIEHGGKWHLIYSAGWYQSGKGDSAYIVAHAVASRLAGPWRKTGAILVGGNGKKVFGPGHQAYVKTPKGEEWLLYHGWDDQNEPRYGSNPLGRTLRLDRMMWENDRPRIMGPTTTKQDAPRV